MFYINGVVLHQMWIRKNNIMFPFCHNEAFAVMIKPPMANEDNKSSNKVKVVVASSVVGGVVVGSFAVFGVMLVVIISEFFGGGCVAAPQIRVFFEMVSPAYTIKIYTIKMLTDTSKSLLLFFYKF